MKKFIVFFLIVFSLNSFSQEKKLSYHFDYYSVYEFNKEGKDNLKSIKELYFSNSKDSTFILEVSLENEVVKRAALLDFSNLKITIFKDERNLNNYNDVRLFNQASTTDYNLDNCRNTSNYFYEINYDSPSVGFISIVKYKNSKKKNIVDEFVVQTKPSEIAKNQHYNFGPFANPLWCWKFALKNKDIIIDSYVLTKGKKKYFRKLLEITKTDFTINIDSTKNTQQ